MKSVQTGLMIFDRILLSGRCLQKVEQTLQNVEQQLQIVEQTFFSYQSKHQLSSFACFLYMTIIAASILSSRFV
jgi:hypothetical protein